MNTFITLSSSLPLPQFYAILKLRQDVFTLEQQCIWNDLDGCDLESLHLAAWEGSTLTGCARLQIFPTHAYFQRLAVAPAYRGQGIASALLNKALEYCQSQNIPVVKLEAQSHLEAFYARFGFVTQGPAYMDAGIEHVPMKRTQTFA
jgi:ElaA protein